MKLANVPASLGIAFALFSCMKFAYAQNAPATTAPSQMVTLTTIVPDGKPHTIQLKNKQFQIDGQPTLLIAGEMHFGRIQPQDFELRVKQAKAMGLNTISFYLFWNLVEPEEGKFDFTGMNDVRRMLKICQDNGMWAVLRPGPYCCAEVEYGGIPYWTLKYPDVKIRTNDPKYVEWSQKYIEQVYKEVADFQVTRGGPLLIVQIENEFGMIAGGNYDYMTSLRGIFKDVGFEVPLYACDPFFGGLGRGGNRGASLPTTATPLINPYGDDILRARNDLRNEQAYRQTAAAVGDMPVYASEVYTGWFTGWDQPIATRYASDKQTVDWTNFLLDHNCSWCYYVFFGGTNYGFDNGCNEYLPVQTSYNYSAPVEEAGRITAKYKALRDILAARTGRTLPDPPPDPAVSDLPPITLDQKEPLVDWLPEKPTLTSEKPVSMESMDQAYGFVLYRKKFPDGIKGKLELKHAMDYTIVMANGKTIAKSFIGYGPTSNVIDIDEPGPVTLDLLVYNLGRISVIVNSSAPDRARKGLIGGAFLDGTELTGWDIYSLPMTDIDHFKASTSPHTGPTFYRATFNVDKPASTFLDMRNWGFGVVWVNGHNLGRYWDVGALRSLFLPSQFLKTGENEITVLELHDAPKTPQISGGTKIIEETPVHFAMKLDQRVPASQSSTVR
jgi:beta-galactosidase